MRALAVWLGSTTTLDSCTSAQLGDADRALRLCAAIEYHLIVLPDFTPW